MTNEERYESGNKKQSGDIAMYRSGSFFFLYHGR